MDVIKTISEFRSARSNLGSVGFVPTMGALHEGHLSLLRDARRVCDHVAVSIFVNPTQFGPTEDFSKYPRTVDEDLAKCEAEGVDFVFMPDVDQLYPPSELDLIVDVPDLTNILEGAHRLGHFVGVCRVVAKLLMIVQPEHAFFGLKDYQQLRVIAAMVDGLCMPVRIEPCPIIRESDGLAMSSRNVYLTDEKRRHAVGLYKALTEAKSLVDDNETDPAVIESAMAQVLKMHHMEVDYAVIRDATTLTEVDSVNPSIEPVVSLIAAKLGNVRLIDNMVFGT